MRVFEPARLSTPPKPLFSLKPLDARSSMNAFGVVAPDGKLVITAIQKDDYGVYTCIATSGHGEAKHSTTLVVICKKNIMMQRTANENAACMRRICKRPDQPKIERLVNNDARLILRKKLNGATTRKSPN